MELVKYGNGGVYRPEYSMSINCFEYALFIEGFEYPLFYFNDTSHSTEYYSFRFQGAIEKYAVSCRRIAAYDTPIDVNNEYRVAVRAPNNPGRLYHVIYQLSDGTWAGKDDQGASEHFDNGNPSISPEMWSDDAYPASAGTIYFAVERW